MVHESANTEQVIGKSVKRSDGRSKVTGKLRFVNDREWRGMLHSALVRSPHAHAKIVAIDDQKALDLPGVVTVLKGEDLPFNLGLYLGDKPPLAREKVRHYGEPVAAVVAETKEKAEQAAAMIEVRYEQLEVINSPEEALKEDAPLLHKEMHTYRRIPPILPEHGTNVANRTKIRKGDVEKGFQDADESIEGEFSFAMGDHVAMEPRVSIGEIQPDGQVNLESSTQAPFVVRALMSAIFEIPAGKITVKAPPLGGGFGGKAGIQLEALAYLLSRAANGQPVKVVNSREEDLVSSPGRMGMEAKVKFGAKSDGTITAAELKYLFNSGAYADYAVNISRAAAISCTGPYNIPNVWCDSLCVYTNHPFATAFRGFGHIELAFAVERGMDLLADKLDMDPMDLRLKNAIKSGDTSPTQSLMDENTGDLKKCLHRVGELLNWDRGNYESAEEHKVRAKGLGCLWKAPAMPTNSDAGAVVTFNEDGSVNLHTGIIEIGQGTQTSLAQLVAERFKTSVDKVHVKTEIDTQTTPHDWATAASRSLFMAGNAALEAADDAISQLKRTAAIVLRCRPHELVVAGGEIYLPDEPELNIPVSEVALGYMYPNGHTIEGQVIGRGKYISRRLSHIDPETGEGEPALEWTLGAEGVEVEIDLEDYSYKVLRAASVMDVGKVIHPDLARGQVEGAMGIALSLTSREKFAVNQRGKVQNDDLRNFKVMRYGEHPELLVDFVETPQQDGPYNARGLGEQGVIGIPGAFANALSKALGVPVNALPLTPERLWYLKERGDHQ